MVSVLNKVGISEVIRDCLMADRDILYGNGKLLNYITVDPTEFSTATVSVTKPYAMYIWTDPGETEEERASNQFDGYIIGVRIRGKQAKHFTAIKQMDLIWERVKVLLRENMTSGNYLTDYHDDPNAQIFSFNPVSSDLPAPDNVDGEYVSECNGAIELHLNRY
jgi:hypothetical protein